MVLKQILAIDVYEHFLLLNCAVNILSCNTYKDYWDIAQSLLMDYIQGHIKIYGMDSVGSNVHLASHAVADVKKFGCLPGISAYPFENYLGQMKGLLRSGHRPLAQLTKRIAELRQQDLFKNGNTFEIYGLNVNSEKMNELPSFVVYTADIENMYRPIFVNEADTDLQKIVWSSAPGRQMKEF